MICRLRTIKGITNYELRIKRLGTYKYLFCIATLKMQDTGGG
ncbi:hypothetical protein C5S29_01000 [ANME-1 cluster archaeon GoMg3.2]|nr:hypothetical protein [ANME-1 cluster archaeon GoMg3.2]